MTELPRFVDPRRLLAKHGLAPKRRFSQNFLVARSVVEAIAVEATALQPPALLELGPGLGTLTVELMRRCPRVMAIEQDPDMLKVLSQELEPFGLMLRRGDAARMDYHALREELGVADLHLVGNLPYSATGAILRGIAEQRASIASAVLMLQREVRDRLIAQPGTRQWGALTVFCRLGFTIDTALHVPATAFVPRPKVSSSVIHLRRRPTPLAHESDDFRSVVHAAFQQRRKTLRKALSSLDGSDRAEGALRDAGIDGQRRGETLSIEELSELAAAWGAL